MDIYWSLIIVIIQVALIIYFLRKKQSLNVPSNDKLSFSSQKFIVEKLFSGSYGSLMFCIVTLCFMMLGTLFLVRVKLLSVEVFLGMFGTFGLIVQKLIDLNFQLKKSKEESIKPDESKPI